MPTREILTYPHPILREKCKPVEKITEEIVTLVQDMTDTMYSAPGIGLAAPQVGVNARVIVVDVAHDDEEGGQRQLYQIINPEIIRSSGSVETEEGCLSLPGVRELVKRAEQVTIKGLDINAKDLLIEAEGLFAICLQHEIDHLNGVLILDHLSRLKKELAKSKLKKLT